MTLGRCNSFDLLGFYFPFSSSCMIWLSASTECCLTDKLWALKMETICFFSLTLSSPLLSLGHHPDDAIRIQILNLGPWNHFIHCNYEWNKDSVIIMNDFPPKFSFLLMNTMQSYCRSSDYRISSKSYSSPFFIHGAPVHEAFLQHARLHCIQSDWKECLWENAVVHHMEWLLCKCAHWICCKSSSDIPGSQEHSAGSSCSYACTGEIIFLSSIQVFGFSLISSFDCWNFILKINICQFIFK